MNDRGEKIVNLAREMLRAEQLPEMREPMQTSIPFKVLCITAILAALGGSTVTELINETRRPITRYEKVELDALVFYAARVKGLNEDNLRQDIENRAGIDNFGDFTERDYRLAKTYLQTKIQ